jgi:hypothetical protein
MSTVVRKRSRFPSTEDEVGTLPLGDLDAMIAHLEWRANNGSLSHQLRKASFNQLVWLEAQRERLHGVSAPPRRPRRARI